MKAILLHDDTGKIRGIAVPGQDMQGKKFGVRSKRGHTALMVEIPDGSPDETLRHCLHLHRTHWVDVGRQALVKKNRAK